MRFELGLCNISLIIGILQLSGFVDVIPAVESISFVAVKVSGLLSNTG